MTDNWKCGMVDWDQGSGGLCNEVGNQGMLPLEFVAQSGSFRNPQ